MLFSKLNLPTQCVCFCTCERSYYRYWKDNKQKIINCPHSATSTASVHFTRHLESNFDHYPNLWFKKDDFIYLTLSLSILMATINQNYILPTTHSYLTIWPNTHLRFLHQNIILPSLLLLLLLLLLIHITYWTDVSSVQWHHNINSDWLWSTQK